MHKGSKLGENGKMFGRVKRKVCKLRISGRMCKVHKSYKSGKIIGTIECKVFKLYKSGKMLGRIECKVRKLYKSGKMCVKTIRRVHKLHKNEKIFGRIMCRIWKLMKNKKMFSGIKQKMDKFITGRSHSNCHINCAPTRVTESSRSTKSSSLPLCNWISNANYLAQFSIILPMQYNPLSIH